MITYKYEVRDLEGRLWAKTLTSIKAARLVKELFQTRRLVCQITEVK